MSTAVTVPGSLSDEEFLIETDRLVRTYVSHESATLRAEFKSDLQRFRQSFSRGPASGAADFGADRNNFGAQLAAKSEFQSWLRGPHMVGMKIAFDLPYTSLKAAIANISPTAHYGPMVGPQYPAARLRSILSGIPVSSGLIEFAQETAFTNAAASVVEGALKPQTGLTFTNKVLKLDTTAHWVQVSLQSLQDLPQLESWIDSRLAYGCQLAEETRFINDPVNGLLANSVPLDPAYAPPAPATPLDAIAAAISQLEASGYSPDAIILSGPDAGKLRLLKSTTGEFIWSTPNAPLAAPSTWGVTTIVSPALAPDTFIVAALNQCCLLFDRMAFTVAISFEDQDNFVKNLATVRGELRSGLAVPVPAGIIVGTATWPAPGGVHAKK